MECPAFNCSRFSIISYSCKKMGKTPVWAWENTRAPKAHFYLFFSIAGCPGKARAFYHFVFFYNSVGDRTRETNINISYVCMCIHRNWKLAVARHWVMSNVLQFYFHSSFFKTCFSHFHFLYIYIYIHCNYNWYFWTWVLSSSSWILQQYRIACCWS